MRTIKFRGKDIKTGEWLYVDLRNKESVTEAFIATIHRCNVKIKPETIGQFTGLTDKNGNEIYEGDIVQSKLKRLRIYDEILQICFANSEYCGKDKYGSSTSLSLLEDYHTLEVIGNIHDNPELINGNYKE